MSDNKEIHAQFAGIDVSLRKSQANLHGDSCAVIQITFPDNVGQKELDYISHLISNDGHIGIASTQPSIKIQTVSNGSILLRGYNDQERAQQFAALPLELDTIKEALERNNHFDSFEHLQTEAHEHWDRKHKAREKHQAASFVDMICQKAPYEQMAQKILDTFEKNLEDRGVLHIEEWKSDKAETFLTEIKTDIVNNFSMHFLDSSSDEEPAKPSGIIKAFMFSYVAYFSANQLKERLGMADEAPVELNVDSEDWQEHTLESVRKETIAELAPELEQFLKQQKQNNEKPGPRSF